MTTNVPPMLRPPAQTLYELGMTAARAGDFARAAECLAQVVAMTPGSAAAANDLGVVLNRLERRAAALASYDRAIALEPGYAEAHNNRANVLRQLKDWNAALAGYDRAIAAKPGYAEAHHNRGVLLNDGHRWDEALASYDRAIALRSSYANAHCNRGVTLEHLDRLEDALASYDAAIAHDATLVRAHVNRGNVLRALRRPAEALASCDRALAVRPDDAQAHLNKAMALLTLGELTAGWREYEWRWRCADGPLARTQRHWTAPPWLGRESLTGRSILIHSEQGLGDTLQFCRYVPLVAALGAKVIFEVQPALVELLADLPGVAQLIAQGDALPVVDRHCPLMSLPLAFDTTLANVPARVPYLPIRPDRRKHWQHRLGLKLKPRVGLVWSGGLRPDQPETWAVNQRRNIPLHWLTTLHHPAIEFHSLQKGQPAEAELAALTATGRLDFALIDHGPHLRDFTDTAALVEQLDLVICVDTSTAHLTGALGKPVWILDRFDSCWRWMQGRCDTPWYPTARLYRQERRGDWSPVIDRVRADLTRLFG